MKRTHCDRCGSRTGGTIVRNAHDHTGCAPIDPVTHRRVDGHDFCPECAEKFLWLTYVRRAAYGWYGWEPGTTGAETSATMAPRTSTA